METEQATAPVSGPPKGAVRVELDDGHWIDMTVELSGRDWLTMHELGQLDPTKPEELELLLDKYPAVLGMIERHTVGHNLPGRDILDRPPIELTQIYRKWRAARAGAAVPKRSGRRSPRRSRAKR